MATTRKTGTTTRKPAAKPAAARKPAARKAPAKPRAKASAAPAPARTAHSASMASLGALAVAALGAVAFGAWRLLRRPAEGVEPTDLMGDEHPDGSERAIPAFRPDPTAPVPASEREQFRPALAQLGNTVS
ncbi:hypothetical protein HZY97_18990 [Sphingomonas sp. R-74633]|uniref:hypothetical protein n=1 Tax=Sphingomonas sp. R-74633 TaxID=2751188 RepID=UPI0015D139B5|nr:hypothetical protein [Sphingomonas sp. R-74633]NYT42867.1 hypothetical protein [Sphingomonas sp. R-74633]